MIFSYLLNMQSHPSWVCGLKLRSNHEGMVAHDVTPFVGVWIETPHQGLRPRPGYVTPFVGVWIETPYHAQHRI